MPQALASGSKSVLVQGQYHAAEGLRQNGKA